MKLGLGIARQETAPSLLSNWDKVPVLTLVSAASSNGLGTTTLCAVSFKSYVPLIKQWFWKVQFTVWCNAKTAAAQQDLTTWPWLCMLCVLGNIRAYKSQELPRMVLEHCWLK